MSSCSIKSKPNLTWFVMLGFLLALCGGCGREEYGYDLQPSLPSDWKVLRAENEGPVEDAKIASLDFVDSQNGWTLGQQLMRTEDGGKTWKSQGVSNGVAMDFINRDVGWVATTEPDYRKMSHL